MNMRPTKGSFFLIICFCVASLLEAEPLYRNEIRDAVSRKAVCNDGSPGIYFFRPGSGGGAKRWVIWLECRVGWCTGPYCDGTSLDRTDVLEGFQDGLLSSFECQNPDFYNANVVYMINCSRDLFSGNNTFVGGAGPIHFRGRNLFRSTIEDLINKPGSTLNEPGAEVLLSGGNCGGIGVLSNLDWLAERLPEARVRGLDDNGWWFQSRTPGWVGYDYDTFRDEFETSIKVWKSEVNEACALANPTKKSNCFLPLVYPYLKTPLFVQFSQWDWHFVGPGSSANTRRFARDARRSLERIPAAFSSQYSITILAYHREFASLKVEGYSMADLLGNWFFDRAGMVKAISTVPNSVAHQGCRPEADKRNVP